MVPARFTTRFIAALTAASTAYVYHVETSPSIYEKAAHQMGLEGQKPQALLNIFSMAGYLERQKLWTDLNRSKIFGDKTAEVFYKANTTIKHNSEHTAKYLFGRSAHYFWETPLVTEKEAQDWILYAAQNAFDRRVGQERNELKSHDWMKMHKNEYMAAAKILGMIDRIDPDRTSYDEGWIAGASRPGILSRIMDYKLVLDHGVKINGPTKVLAGARPLWAEIDGINPDVLNQLLEALAKGTKVDDIKVVVPAQAPNATIEEGIDYIKDLAHKLNIPLQKPPVIKYSTKEACPKGLFPGRTYPNYANPNGPKLDESAMSLDVLTQVLGKHKVDIVDTKSTNDQRPTTATTAADAVKSLLQDISDGKYGDKKEFHILFETNQPYVERQTLSAQKAIQMFLPFGISITLHGVGFEFKQDVATVHSELGALIYEKWKVANPYGVDKNLCFQTRDNDAEVPPLGDDAEVG